MTEEAKIKLFFDKYSIAGNILFSSGDKNLSVDGTGILPSVGEKEGKNILLYIKKFYPECKNILDVGSGVGHITKCSDDIPGINCFSFEGCKDLIPNVVCDKNKYAIVDLSKPLDNIDLYKAFDMTTSFEVLEHVHRNHQDQFWENLKYLSNSHLCSIHVANDEHDAHCTIQNLETWKKYLENIGEVEVLGMYPAHLDSNNDTCIFRKETHISNWNCSIMLYIKFH